MSNVNLHTHLQRDALGYYHIKLAQDQNDPLLHVGTGQLNTMSPAVWNVFHRAQLAQDALQDALAELFGSNEYPFKAPTAVKKHNVIVRRVETKEHAFDVECTSLDEARAGALAQAADHDFGSHDASDVDYTVESITTGAQNT